ncbi:MAG: PAS domain-containing protein [Bacteroides sp.]|nr:PAS domain-containing protein [Bacteroides sp.]
MMEEQELRKENERLRAELSFYKKKTELSADSTLEKAIRDEKEAHQMMRTIFRKLPSAILIKDIEDDYRFYIVNKKFEQMCNMPQEALVGKTDYEVFPKDEADKYRKDDIEASAYTEEAPMLIHEIVTSPDRGVSTHLQTIKFSFSFKGKRLLVCVGMDVTLQHQMMDQL